jgi:hypothetical protein
MGKNIVSFNYNGCFDQPDVLRYAKELNDRGYRIFILGRYAIVGDIIDLCDENGITIDEEHIFLVPPTMEKIEFLEQNDFVFHLETDPIEIKNSEDTQMLCDVIQYGASWKKRCEEAIEARCFICGGKFYHKLSCPTGKLTIYLNNDVNS